MRTILSLLSAGMILLGLWLMASDGMAPAPVPATAGQTIGARHQAASPLILGVVLLAGGVVSLIAVLRRR
jgi:hypothetical protein